MTKTKLKLNNSSGFTLIEILIVTVFVTGVFVSIYAFFANTIKHDIESRYEIIASNLAQEGVEIVRNIRDENALAEDNINKNDGGTFNDGDSCQPYMDGDEPECDNIKNAKVGIDGDNVYKNCSDSSCSSMTETSFTRSCNIDEVGSYSESEAFMVTCTVSWKSFVNSDIDREVEASSILTAWQ